MNMRSDGRFGLGGPGVPPPVPWYGPEPGPRMPPWMDMPLPDVSDPPVVDDDDGMGPWPTPPTRH